MPSAVVMLFASRTPPVEVERVARATEALAAGGIPVPALYRVEPEERRIVQEDLGTVHLADGRAQGLDLRGLYRQAVSLLPRLQALDLDTCPSPPLDAERMNRELQHFARGAVASGGPALDEDLTHLAEAAAALPTVLCHRDYHARNLLVQDGQRLRVIDHQDAMPGPAPYDRVSLGYDPYVQLADETRDALAGDAPGTAIVAVQRLCKAIGTYAHAGGPWAACLAPAARQARRLLPRTGLVLHVLDAALVPLALRGNTAAAVRTGGTS